MQLEFWDWFKNKFKGEVGAAITESGIVEEPSEPYFPCSSDDCLIRAACTQACDKIEMDEDKLMGLFLKYNCCPDCGGEQFMEGPSGGMSTNVRCSSCKHWFNMSLPVCIERIHIDSNGVFR